METDITRIERRIRGAGMPVSRFLEENKIPPSTWYTWKQGAERPLSRWVEVLTAVEALEADEQ